MPAIMNFSEPLVTPEELHSLLGWPLPASPSSPAQRVQPATADAPVGQPISGLSLDA